MELTTKQLRKRMPSLAMRSRCGAGLPTRQCAKNSHSACNQKPNTKTPSWKFDIRNFQSPTCLVRLEHSEASTLASELFNSVGAPHISAHPGTSFDVPAVFAAFCRRDLGDCLAQVFQQKRLADY